MTDILDLVWYPGDPLNGLTERESGGSAAVMLDARPADDEGIDGWRVARVRCRFCGHEVIAVFPVEADELSLECSRCGICESEVLINYPPEEATDAEH